jgi:hypothetical protein
VPNTRTREHKIPSTSSTGSWHILRYSSIATDRAGEVESSYPAKQTTKKDWMGPAAKWLERASKQQNRMLTCQKTQARTWEKETETETEKGRERA